MEVPKKLFHAAPECVVSQIYAEGLRSQYSGIYATESPAEALTFMWFRILDHPHYTNEDGKLSVEFVRHDAIHVWEINTAKTKKDLWEVGNDHSPQYFGNASSWVYMSKELPRKALAECWVYTREDIESALAISKK